MISIMIIAAYLVALFCDKRALTLLFSAVCCEFIGWSPLFVWTHDYRSGMLNFVMWGVIYALYALLEGVKGRLLLVCVAMVLFQLSMSADSYVSNGAETYLYLYYEHILMLIHCYILSSFITRGSVIRLLGNISSVFRAFVNGNVLNLVFWYTMGINQKTN